LLIGVNDGDGTNCGGSCIPVPGNLAATTPVAPAEALVFRATYTGTYYARVFTGVSTTVGTGDYLLSISLNNDHGPTAADSSIAGRVTGTTGEPVAGVTMVLTNGAGTKRTSTDADGNYSFPDLETGDFFVVAPATGNYTFSPSRRPFSLRSNVKNANFTANAAWAERTQANEGIDPAERLNGLDDSNPSSGRSTEQSWPAAAISAAPHVSDDSLSIQQQIAAGPAAKIQIRHTGWYRVSQPDLIAAGLDPSANARMLQLYVDGEEVPIRLSGDPAHLTSNDTMEFYGVGLDTPTTDTRTYWLINGSGPGQRISGRRNKVNPSYLPSQENLAVRNFASTTERKEKLTYFPNLLNGDEENIFGSLVMTDPTTESLTVKNFDSESTTQAELEIALQGVTLLNHQIQVKLNGNYVGNVGFNARTHSVTKLLVDRSLLCEGDNIVSLAATGGDSDISFVDWIRLTYARRYVAENNSLKFSVPGGQVVRVTGFTTPNIRVVDVTNPKSVTELEAPFGHDSAGYFIRLQTRGTGARSLLAFADDLAESPTVTGNQPSTLNLGTNSADLVIITHKNFRQAIEPLAELRRSQGLRVAVVDVEDVFDEFSYGVHTPAALKSFLAWAAQHWASAPQYLLLVGDSSWDPRNYFGEGDNDFVPTKLIDTFYMETASDDWLVDFNGTGLPNIAVGRLPARTVGDVNLMVSKILAYEQERQLGAPLRGAVMVADSGFEAESNQTRALLPSGIPVLAINRAFIGNDDIARNQIIDALNHGPMLVNYYGHGSVGEWTGAGLFETDLANGLTNTNQLSLFVMMTCLNGYAHDAYIDSLGEAALKAPQGGAMAVWASSGLTESGPQFAMGSEFYRQIFGTQSLRLGRAIQNAKAATTDSDVRRTWMLLGDPTMHLR